MIQGVTAAIYPEYREIVWPFLLGFEKRDLDGVRARALEEDILARDRQCWSINDFQAVALTCVTAGAVRITHCAGVRAREWRDAFDDEMRAWARALGKRRVVAVVRPGWARWGVTRGYREAHREMVLEIA